VHQLGTSISAWRTACAIEASVTRFDVSPASIEGSSASRLAAGNVAIEDVAALFNTMGMATGVDTKALQELREFVGAQPDTQALLHAVARAAARRRGGRFAARVTGAAAGHDHQAPCAR
jgi:hypothetical protein